MVSLLEFNWVSKLSLSLLSLESIICDEILFTFKFELSLGV
jgi:hypothetical protein